MLFMETTAVRCEAGTKHTNTLCGRGVERPNVEGLFQGQDFRQGREIFTLSEGSRRALGTTQHTVQGTTLRPAEFSNGRLGASQHCCNPVMFVLVLSASVNTVDLVTVKFQANTHPPLATSPHPVGPSTRTANSSTGQKPCNAICRDRFFRR